VDHNYFPAPINERYLAKLSDPLVVPELSKFNVELNGTPQPLRGNALSRMHAELAATWQRCQDVAHALDAALVMIGIPPFFGAFGPQPTVEERLAANPEALEGFRRVLRRSHRAARFAIGFAAHRLDRDAAVIHDAALLHDFAELLLWLEAPALALEIARRQSTDATLRSAAAQRELLNIELVDLQHHLMLAWRLPRLLVEITDDHAKRETPQLTNVRLAIRVARHSTEGWDNAALPDDYADLGQLLQLSPPHVQRLLRDIDAQ